MNSEDMYERFVRAFEATVTANTRPGNPKPVSAIVMCESDARSLYEATMRRVSNPVTTFEEFVSQSEPKLTLDDSIPPGKVCFDLN